MHCMVVHAQNVVFVCSDDELLLLWVLPLLLHATTGAFSNEGMLKFTASWHTELERKYTLVMSCSSPSLPCACVICLYRHMLQADAC